jgi:hypothetical protein
MFSSQLNNQKRKFLFPFGFMAHIYNFSAGKEAKRNQFT